MHCHEARRRVTTSRGNISDSLDCRELQEHLSQCPDCAAMAAAERMLDQDLEQERQYRPEVDLPLKVVMGRVNAKAVPVVTNPSRGALLMLEFKKNVIERPRLSISLAVAFLILVSAVVIPLKVDESMGYQVALAGVNPDLALDEARVHELLDAVNAANTRYDIDGCEATCKVRISNIKDADQVRVVIEAFNKMGNIVVDSILELSEQGQAVNLDLRRLDEKSTVSTDELHEIIVEGLNKLNSSGPGQFTIWQNKAVQSSGIGVNQHFIAELNDPNTEVILRVDDHNVVHVLNENGDTELLDLDDPGTIDRLSQLGYDASISEQGGRRVFSVSGGDASGSFSGTVVLRQSDYPGTTAGSSTSISNNLDFSSQQGAGVRTNDQLRSLAIKGLKSRTGSDPGQFVIWRNNVAHSSGAGSSASFASELSDPATEVLFLIDEHNLFHVQNEQGAVEVLDPEAPGTQRRLSDLGYNVDLPKVNGYSMLYISTSDSSMQMSSTIPYPWAPDADAADDAASVGTSVTPDSYWLAQNFPNPFNPSTQISFNLPYAEHVNLEVYNINGQRVKSLVNEVRSAGEHTVTWDGTNESSQPVASGIYFYRLRAGSFTQSRKMSLVK